MSQPVQPYVGKSAGVAFKSTDRVPTRNAYGAEPPRERRRHRSTRAASPPKRPDVKVTQPTGHVPSSRHRPSPPMTTLTKQGAPVASYKQPGTKPVVSSVRTHRPVRTHSVASAGSTDSGGARHYYTTVRGDPSLAWPPPGAMWWVNVNPEENEWQQRPPDPPNWSDARQARPAPWLRTVKIDNLTND
ncbi:hypothetical protein DIPPA_28473 [Diplonema papillatum]|nr:hypothetical protein DIPPA_28473 [Diplonema papillatum]|eukprot:gene5682-8669_t